MPTACVQRVMQLVALVAVASSTPAEGGAAAAVAKGISARWSLAGANRCTVRLLLLGDVSVPSPHHGGIQHECDAWANL
jgi:hypothetical protein